MLVLAHRGANRQAPENTVPAMVRALEVGADGVELDVHRTADGALVVRHDVETPVGPVTRLTRAELAVALPEVPVLEEVLDVCRGRLVNVEIKDPDPRAVDRAAVALLEARARGATRCWCRRSTSPTVDRVRDLAPDVPSAFLSFGLDPLEALDTAASTATTPCTPTCGRCCRATRGRWPSGRTGTACG